MARKSLDALYNRPGFMIRRAHQISVSVFLEETAELGVTTTQFGILHLLANRSAIDQVTVARMLGLDRSTTGMVIKSLETAGLVRRVIDDSDKRRRSLELTEAGRDLFRQLKRPAAAAVDRLLQPLAEDERPIFLALLKKLTNAFNETSRVPLLEDNPLSAKPAPPRARLRRKVARPWS